MFDLLKLKPVLAETGFRFGGLCICE